MRLRKPSAIGLSLLTLVTGAVLTTVSTAAAPSSAAADTRWIRDYSDDFAGPLDESAWGSYGWGYQPVNNGAMGVYKQDNVFTRDGSLVLRTQYRDGGWTSAGVSGHPGFTAVGGKWELRAKMPYAKGLGYAFLLWPADDSWPPEVDIAEGRANGRVESYYHWGTPQQNYQDYSFNEDVDPHEWHTYGVILGDNQIIFTIDGDNVTGVIDNVPVTDKPMWMGMQTGAMDPNGSARAYETVDGGVPNAQTPATSDIEIAWMAHYHS